jgi:hypothetical protein
VQSVLSGVTSSDVTIDPFPHVVVRDAIDEGLCEHLQSEFPRLDLIAGNGSGASNRRFGMPASAALEGSTVSPLWREFVARHSSPQFLQEIIDVFGDEILRLHPTFEQTVGELGTLRPGVRRHDSFDTADVLLDAQISVNTPVVERPTSVRRAHLDDPEKVVAGLLYMRSPDDTSTGGDLTLYRYKNGARGFRQSEIYDRFVEPVKTVRYERNVLVMFVNSPASLHGVTVRSLTDVPRYFVNFVAEVREPLFDVDAFQASWVDKLVAAPERARRRLRGAA